MAAVHDYAVKQVTAEGQVVQLTHIMAIVVIERILGIVLKGAVAEGAVTFI